MSALPVEAPVGSRLRSIRTWRRLTLEDVSSSTGISRSTLSRLENGQRRPTLELLLDLAATYRVSLDDLVGAPETGDQRLRPRLRRVKGRAVVPLTTDPHGVQAWKIVIPAALSKPSLRAHEGREWLHVLAGRLRLVIGDRDVVLGPGETADFDTTTPHWFGSTGEGDVEALSLYSPSQARAGRPPMAPRGRWSVESLSQSGFAGSGAVCRLAALWAPPNMPSEASSRG